MKSFRKILLTVRDLPEEVRKLLALLFLLVAAILLFNKWATGISTRLTLSSVSLSSNKQRFSAAAENPPAPLASIADSWQSLGKIVKSPPAYSADSSESLNQKVKDKISDSLAGLYVILEKIWRYIYEPLKK